MTIDEFISAVREADLQGEKEVLVDITDLVQVVNHIQNLQFGIDNLEKELNKIELLYQVTKDLLEVKNEAKRLDEYA